MRLCYKVCALLLEWFMVALSHGKVIFSDECAIYCSSLSWNVLWGKTESFLHAWDIRPPTTHDDSAGVTVSYTGWSKSPCAPDVCTVIVRCTEIFDHCVSLAHISLMELLVVLHVLNVELCYTRAKQQWDYVTGVISARSAPAHFILTVCKFLIESLQDLWLCNIPFTTTMVAM